MLIQQLECAAQLVLLDGLLGEIHVRGVKVLFRTQSLAVDAIDRHGRTDEDRQQQQRGRGDEARQDGFAPAPAPGTLDA
jgi:hypothetical protein